MRLWADIYDASGTRLGDGPLVNLSSARVIRALDGAGAVQVVAPLSDARARELLTNERRIRIFIEENNRARELGRGVLREIRVTSDALMLSADGPDAFDEMKRVSVLLAREYLSMTPSAIAAGLVGLVDGWTLSAEATANVISARYDGVSVLKALQLLAEQQGLHLRLGTRPRQVEFGAFGVETGLVLINAESATYPLQANDDVALIEQLSIDQSTEAAANWLVPLGAGEGVAQLTLEKATRSGPYTVQSMAGPNGETLYYLADEASIAAYGRIEKVGVYRNIAPVTNSEGDIINAANALYDAASAWLARSARRQDTYRVNLKKARTNIRPGDVVRLLYRGIVERDGVPYTYLDVDDSFYVLKVTEAVTTGGVATSLVISTVDRYAQDAAQILIGALEAIEIRNVFVQPYPTRMGFYSYEDIDSTHPVQVPVAITDATLALTRVLVRLRTRPLRSNTKALSAGGAHRHRMFEYLSNPGFSNTRRQYRARFPSGSSWNYASVIFEAASSDDLYTESENGDHTHPVEYGIYDDTEHPQSISLWINGIDRTSALGGPWGPSNAPVDVEVEISDYLINASGGLRQVHTLEWRCASGKGRIETEIEVVDVIQPIRV